MKLTKELSQQLFAAYELCSLATEFLGNVIASGKASENDVRLHKQGKKFLAFCENLEAEKEVKQARK